jgi:OPA family glycerol-3-phosphate transporter-like MFS transporter
MTNSTLEAPPKKRSWLSAPPHKPRLADEVVRKLYPRLRMQVFLGIFIGYAGYYLIRNNVPLVATLLRDENGISAIGLGIISNALLISYGLSKFLAGIISDRSNARYFLSIGLVLSALANFAIAFIPAVSVSVALFAMVMFLNGLFQGMGWPPSGRTLVHWYSTNERGTKTSIWNTAHNVGGAAVGGLVAFGLSEWGGIAPAFWFPAVVAIIVAVVTFFLMKDTPQSEGLPPIEEFRNDPPKVASDDEESKLSVWTVVRKHVLANVTMVNLALANVFVYALRYGVLVWAPLYLVERRGASLGEGIAGFSVFEIAGILGTLLCGYLSDKVFKGARTQIGVLFLLGVGAALAVYWLVDGPIWIAFIALAVIGGLIYGPVMLIGLQAIDLSPRHIAGTAAGFTGLFGYVLGATLASTGIGLSVEFWGWDVTFMLLLGCVVLAMLFYALAGKDEKRLMQEQRDAAKVTRV